MVNFLIIVGAILLFFLSVAFWIGIAGTLIGLIVGAVLTFKRHIEYKRSLK